VHVVDGKDRENESVYTEESFEDEEGEADLYDAHAATILQKLDPETRERFEKGEMDEQEMKNLGILPDDADEEGEAEFEDYGSDGGSGDEDAGSNGAGGDDDDDAGSNGAGDDDDDDEKDEDDYEEGE